MPLNAVATDMMSHTRADERTMAEPPNTWQLQPRLGSAYCLTAVGAGVASGTSELKTSRRIFQFPSLCFRQTSMYFPESGSSGWPGTTSTYEYFP